MNVKLTIIGIFFACTPVFADHCNNRVVVNNRVVQKVQKFQKVVKADIISEIVLAVPVQSLDVDHYYDTEDNCIDQDALVEQIVERITQRLQLNQSEPQYNDMDRQYLRDDGMDNKVQNLINNRCISCHGPSNNSGGLTLTNINVLPLFKRVKILEAVDSQRNRFKLVGNKIQQMPLNGQPLDEEQISLIREWVTETAIREDSK